MNSELAARLFATTGEDTHNLTDPSVAHLMVHHDQVVSSREVPGLDVKAEHAGGALAVRFRVAPGSRIQHPVHLCFGMMPESGVQKIVMDVEIGAGAAVAVRSHCTFPFAVDVLHTMDAEIRVGEGAEYYYFERHVHPASGGVTVVPKAKVHLAAGAFFQTEFELLKGRVGKLDIDYETFCQADSVMEMRARINGTGDDVLLINETGHLLGERARGVLTSFIALRDRATAEIRNKLVASAPYARGHVDCKEIVQGQASASAIPVVVVNHPLAHVTHEAAIGSVDTRQLETLMARGLDEDAAVELIIQGMLSRG